MPNPAQALPPSPSQQDHPASPACISQDYLSFLPDELLLNIAVQCNFQSLKSLSECSWKLHCIAQEARFKRLVGKSFQKTLQTIEMNAEKYVDKVCYRFEALAFKGSEVPIPKDAVDLYEQVKKYRKPDAAKKLGKFLKIRDNLIFWKSLGLSHFDLKTAKSYLEIEEAYSQINKSSADFSQKKFELNNCELTSIPRDLLDYFQIENLDLKNNHITELPKKLKEMPCLKFLKLSGNKLS